MLIFMSGQRLYRSGQPIDANNVHAELGGYARVIPLRSCNVQCGMGVQTEEAVDVLTKGVHIHSGRITSRFSIGCLCQCICAERSLIIVGNTAAILLGGARQAP